MDLPFEFECAYCNRFSTVTNANFSEDNHFFRKDKFRNEPLNLRSYFVLCPNPSCKEPTIVLEYTQDEFDNFGQKTGEKNLKSMRFIPGSSAKVFGDYVPLAIRNDYEEACSILTLSPKAAATLARRALQGMIRDFWGVSRKRNLAQEIEAIEDMVDPSTHEAIDAVRAIGNVGAHMERAIDRIINVDVEEARALVWLIETLIENWYVQKHQREARLQSIIAMREQKDAQRNPPE